MVVIIKFKSCWFIVRDEILYDKHKYLNFFNQLIRY